jgi:hypothetical protein
MKQVPLYVMLLLSLLVSACAGDVRIRNELTSAKAELRELKKERDMYRDKVDRMWDDLERERDQWMDKTYALQQEIRQLEERRHQCTMVESRLSGCRTQVQQLEAWAGALVEGYGPGIWTAGEYFRPVYDREPRQSTVPDIIAELNDYHRKHNNPLLVLKKIDGRTLVIGVSDDRRLTTQMGSSGAQEYLQTAAYSLTSLDRVNCVSFDFEEGDHAAPGRFCRPPGKRGQTPFVPLIIAPEGGAPTGDSR